MIGWSDALAWARRVGPHVGRMSAFPVSLLLRFAVNGLAYVAPLAVALLLFLVPVVIAGFSYQSVPREWRGQYAQYGEMAQFAEVIVALGGFSLLVGMSVNGLKSWWTAMRCLLSEHFKRLQEQPPWFVGLELQDEIYETRKVLTDTAARFASALSQSRRAALLAGLLGLLGAIVPLAADVQSGTEVIMLPVPVDWCDSGECSPCPGCSPCSGCPPCPECPKSPTPGQVRGTGTSECQICTVMPGELEKGQEFLVLYPFYRGGQRDDGVAVHAANAYWLDYIKRNASRCSSGEETVALRVSGFASNQRMNPPEDEAAADESNCGVANARMAAVVGYFADESASWKKVRDEAKEARAGHGSAVRACPGPESVPDVLVETGRVSDGPSFVVEGEPWADAKSMVKVRDAKWGEEGKGDTRQRFRHRSVLVVVEDPGTCGKDG